MRAVVMLHGVDETGSVLSVTSAEFATMIEAIVASGHEIVPLSRWLSEPRERQIALTFDDGFASLALAAAPVLSKAGVSATLFLTTGRIGADNRWPSQPADAPVFDMLDWNGVERLQREGWDIEAHSVNHPDLRNCTDDELSRELDESAAAIEQHLGTHPRIFAYPFGYFDDRVVAAVRERFEWALTARMGTVDQEIVDRHRVPRIDAYYFRDARISKRFGSPAFSAYLAARTLMRRARRHPAELR